MSALTGYGCAVASAVLYGLLPVLAKEFYALGGTALTFVSARFLLSAVIAAAAARVRGISLAGSRKELFKMFLLVQGYMLTNILLSVSYEYISAGLSTTIHFLYPTLVLVVCVVLFGEKLSVSGGVCAVLGLVGVACLGAPGESASVTGLFLAFASAITYAFYVVYDDKSGLAAQNPFRLCFYISVIGGMEALLLGKITGGLHFDLPPSAWLIVLAVALGPTVASISLVQVSLRVIGAGKTSFLSTFEPLTSVVLGIVLLGEQVTVRTGIEILCILCSAGILAVKK